MQNQKSLKRKERFTSVLYAIFALYIIYSTDSLVVALGVAPRIGTASSLIMAVLAVVFLFRMLIKKRGCIAIDLFVCLVAVVLSSLFNFDRTLIGPSKCFSLIVGCYIARELDTKRFIKAFVYGMAVIAAASLVVHIFKDALVATGRFPVLTGYKDQKFVGLLVANVRISPTTSFRNWGPIWEPGAYQAYLIVALLLLMFEKADFKHRNLMIIILLVTIGTTMSTTGLLAIPFLVIAFILDSAANKKYLGAKIAVTILATGFVMWFLESEYFQIVFAQKFETISTVDRVETVRLGLQMFLKKPIFGYSSAYTQVFHQMAGQAFAITNTYIAHLVIYGLVMGVASVAFIYRFVRSYRRSLLVTLLMFMALAVSFSGEKMLYTPIFSFMMFYIAPVESPEIRRLDSHKQASMNA